MTVGCWASLNATRPTVEALDNCCISLFIWSKTMECVKLYFKVFTLLSERSFSQLIFYFSVSFLFYIFYFSVGIPYERKKRKKEKKGKKGRRAGKFSTFPLSPIWFKLINFTNSIQACHGTGSDEQSFSIALLPLYPALITQTHWAIAGM